MNTFNFQWHRGLAGVLAAALLLSPSIGCEPADPHDDHDHDAAGHAEHDQIEHEQAEAPEDDHHESHDEHGHDEASGHGGDHDDHSDQEEGIQIDAATLEEFGISLAVAQTGNLRGETRLSGEVVYNADRVAHVTPTVSGVVRQVQHQVGDRVSAGEVMAVLDSRELAAARSEYLAASARLELAREALEREEQLLAGGVGTENRLLESRRDTQEAQIALVLARQNLLTLGQSVADVDHLADSTSDASLAAYSLRTPLDGIVIDRHLTRGEVVSDQPAEAPFVVADLSSVWVNLTVHQRDLSRVKPGMPVRIIAGHGLTDARGAITFVSPALDETTRTATARVVLDNPDGGWRPGLFVTGIVATTQAATGVVVPRSAITELDGQSVIFVKNQDGFEPTPVELGAVSESNAEIVAGLEAGQTYVQRGVLALKAEMNRAALEHAGHAH